MNSLRTMNRSSDPNPFDEEEQEVNPFSVTATVFFFGIPMLPFLDLPIFRVFQLLSISNLAVNCGIVFTNFGLDLGIGKFQDGVVGAVILELK